VTGLLFGLHPLHVESVAWVSERKDVLYALFYLLSICFYLRYATIEKEVRGSRTGNYLLCLVMFVLSLMSKPMAVTLPAVLLLLDVYPLQRIAPSESPKRAFLPTGYRVFIEKIPFLGLSIILSVITFIAQKSQGAVVHFKIQLLMDRIIIAFHSLTFYLSKILWPKGLVPFYPYPSEVSLFSFEYIGSIILITGITVFCICLWKRRQKVCGTVWAYYVITLLPVLGIIQVGNQAAADRYSYLPGLGPFFVMALIMSIICKKDIIKGINLKNKNRFMIIALIFIVGLLSVKTIQQISIWQDSFTLWKTEMEKFPDAYISYRGLGGAYGERGENEKAIEYFNRSLELNPDDTLSYYNRGIIYGKSGLTDKAREDLSMAVSIEPLNAKFHNELGVALGYLGKYNESIDEFNTAIKLDPQFSKAYYHRGITYQRMGDSQRSLLDFQVAAQMGDNRAQQYLKKMGIRW
jgi:hypothetical protein